MIDNCRRAGETKALLTRTWSNLKLFISEVLVENYKYHRYTDPVKREEKPTRQSPNDDSLKFSMYCLAAPS